MKVSDQFKNIVSNIGVIDQTNEISILTKPEFYLLLLFSIDNFSKFPNQEVAKSNLKFFKTDMMELDKFMLTGKTDNEVLKELVVLTGNDIIDSQCLVDSDEQPIHNIFNNQ